MILYKYLPVVFGNNISEDEISTNIQRCECIRDNAFWFSNQYLLNDPFDCLPLFRKTQNHSELLEILSQFSDVEMNEFLDDIGSPSGLGQVKRLLSSKNKSLLITKESLRFSLEMYALRLVENKISNLGVLSFTTKNNSNPMWAHYAANHKGLCIEVEVVKEIESLKKVSYLPERPMVSLHEAMNEKYGKVEDIFYSKHEDWKYESEWRVINLEGNVRLVTDKLLVRKIQFGSDCSAETMKKVKNIVGDSIETRISQPTRQSIR